MAKSAGKYYPETSLGNVYSVSTAAAGVAIPISTGTALTCGLWNTSTTKNAVLLSAAIGYTSGTIALGEFGLLNQYVGFQVGTAAPMAAITAGTSATVKNLLLGAGKATAMTAFPGTATLTTGGTACYWFGPGKASATAALGDINGLFHEFDGKVIVTPGQVVALCASVAQTGIYTCSLVWSEVDI